MLGDKSVVAQLRVGVCHPGDLLRLARRKLFLRIEAPGSSQQSLTSQHFEDPGNTTADVVIGIGETGRERQPLGPDLIGRVLTAEVAEEFDSPSSPDRPLAQ